MHKPTKTVHSSRTLMFSELANVMGHAVSDDSYLDSLGENVINKKTSSGINKTTGFLKTLYNFDLSSPTFLALKYFWQLAHDVDRNQVALVYAITRDFLLNESIEVASSARIGEKVAVSAFQSNIERIHPARYSESSKEAISQRLASSWKQAGFIEGKVKNIRVQPAISYRVVAFAALLAYLQGDRGDFIAASRPIQALCLSDSQLRELLIQASQNGLLQYQFAGAVTSLSFTALLNKLGIADV